MKKLYTHKHRLLFIRRKTVVVIMGSYRIVKAIYLDKINADSIRKKGLSGEGVKIAIIDSGINSSHPDFNHSNILQGYNCIFGAENINDYSDSIGHGTMVAGIIAAQTDNELDISGIASNAQIIPIKITDTNSLNISSIFLSLPQGLPCKSKMLV